MISVRECHSDFYNDPSVVKQQRLKMLHKREATSETEQSGKKLKNVADFSNLPDEILLLTCRYLSPARVIEVFSHYDQRLSRCISEYHQNINLTKSSYNDLQFFSNILSKTGLQFFRLTLSNTKIPIEIEIFLRKCNSSAEFHPKTVHHLSLLECTETNFFHSTSFLKEFSSLQSLHMIQSTSNQNRLSMNYANNGQFRETIFNSCTMVTDLQLTTNDGIILDKQLRPNECLTKIIISLQNINDLYVLFDGLVPNARTLQVTICQPNAYKRSSLPQSWPNQLMSQLREFCLTTNEEMPFTFDQLRNIVTPLKQIYMLTLVVMQWSSTDEQFVESNQLEMLIQQFMPQLQHFQSSIQTASDINMQTFATVDGRWPMKCRPGADDMCKHFYTVPCPFEHLQTSMLANDDTSSICPAVQSLTINTVCFNLSHRFPNIQTLTIEPEYDRAPTDYLAFRQLRHLTITNINQVPSSVIRRLHTLTLFHIDDLVNHPIIYSNLKYLIVKNNQIGSSALITALVQHFPRLHSLEIQLEPNADYYDNLDVLLTEEYLPNLSLVKTNWIDSSMYSSNVDLWLIAKTRLKWRSTPFYGHHDQDSLTICL